MSFFYTSYYLAKKTINRLEYKYHKYFDVENTKLFLYANSYQIPELFRLTKIHSFDYDLYKKMTNYKQDMFIKNMTKETIKNKYYPNNMLLLYSISISIIFYEELKKTNLKKDDYSKYDYNFAHSKNVDNSGKRLYIKFKNCVIYSFTELDFLKETLSQTYLLPKIDTYISESMKIFKNCLNPNPIFKAYAALMDFTIYKNSETKFKQFICKNKYEIIPDLKVTYDDEEMDFAKFLEIVSNKSLLFLEAINDALFLDKVSTLVEYAKFYNWNSIVEYYDFMNKQKEDEILRNKKISENKKDKKIKFRKRIFKNSTNNNNFT